MLNDAPGTAIGHFANERLKFLAERQLVLDIEALRRATEAAIEDFSGGTNASRRRGLSIGHDLDQSFDGLLCVLLREGSKIEVFLRATTRIAHFAGLWRDQIGPTLIILGRWPKFLRLGLSVHYPGSFREVSVTVGDVR